MICVVGFQFNCQLVYALLLNLYKNTKSSENKNNKLERSLPNIQEIHSGAVEALPEEALLTVTVQGFQVSLLTSAYTQQTDRRTYRQTDRKTDRDRHHSLVNTERLQTGSALILL